MAKLYIITKTYEVPVMPDTVAIKQLTDIKGLFKSKRKANAFWKKCKNKDGYQFDEVETDLTEEN